MTAINRAPHVVIVGRKIQPQIGAGVGVIHLEMMLLDGIAAAVEQRVRQLDDFVVASASRV